MRVLLVEDDDILGEALRDYLAAEGHAVDWVRTLAALRSRQAAAFDCWLVDWQLPDGSGLDWLRQCRSDGATTPALMLTARDRLAERVEGLDSGADDYLVKPFAPEELAARLRALQRRQAQAGATSVDLGGGVRADLTARLATVDGRRVELTAREWAVLEALAMRRPRVVGRDLLESLVLGRDRPAASNALEVHIANLRHKLGRDVVQTVRGQGYRLGG